MWRDLLLLKSLDGESEDDETDAIQWQEGKDGHLKLTNVEDPKGKFIQDSSGEWVEDESGYASIMHPNTEFPITQQIGDSVKHHGGSDEQVANLDDDVKAMDHKCGQIGINASKREQKEG